MNNSENLIRTSNSKITEAFELLNEAAKEKRDEMKELMTDRYLHIKQVVLEGATQGKKILDKAQHVTQEAIAEGAETVKKQLRMLIKEYMRIPGPTLVALRSLRSSWGISWVQNVNSYFGGGLVC